MSFIRNVLNVLFGILIFTIPFYPSIYVKFGFFIVLALLLFLEVLRQKTIGLIWQEVFLGLLFILAMVYFVFGNLNHSSQLNTIFFYYITPFLMLFTVRRLWKNTREWLILGYSYLAGCATATFILIFKWWATGSIKRITIGELNINYVSYCLVTGLAIGAALLVLIKHKAHTRLLTLILILLTIGVFVSGTRGSIISIITLLVAYIYIKFREYPIRVVFMLLSSIILGFILFSVTPSIIFSAILDDGSDDLTNGRSYLWKLAISYISESPIFGNGIDSFINKNPEGIRVHNVFLSILVEFGIIGLLLYTSVIFSIMFTRHTSLEVKQVRIFFIICWLPIAMTGVWEYSVAASFAFAWLIRVPQTFKMTYN